MSDLQDEGKVARKSRRADKLPEEAKVSVRDQIPKKLLKQLKEDGVGNKITKMWHVGNANRQNWIDRQQSFLTDWDEHLVPSAEGAFNIADNMHVPMPLIVAKTMHARFLEATVSLEPLFTVKPRREDGTKRAPLVSDVMHYCLKDWCNEYEGIVPTLDKWIWDWITVGDAFLKTRWERKFTSFIDVEEEVADVSEDVELVETDDGRQFVQPTKTIREVERKKLKKVFDGPIFEAKQFDDVIVIGGDGDPQKSDAVIDRYYLTASDMWTFADTGIFDTEAVQKVINGGPDSQSGSTTGNVKDQRAQIAGLSSADTSVDLDRYEILETYMKHDVDGSG